MGYVALVGEQTGQPLGSIDDIRSEVRMGGTIPGVRRLEFFDTVFTYKIIAGPRPRVQIGSTFSGDGQPVPKADFLRAGSNAYHVETTRHEENGTQRVWSALDPLLQVDRGGGRKALVYLLGHSSVKPIAYDDIMGTYLAVLKAHEQPEYVSGRIRFSSNHFLRRQILANTPQVPLEPQRMAGLLR